MVPSSASQGWQGSAVHVGVLGWRLSFIKAIWGLVWDRDIPELGSWWQWVWKTSFPSQQGSFPFLPGLEWFGRTGEPAELTDVVQISVRNSFFLISVLALLVYGKLDLQDIFRMCLGCFSCPPFFRKHWEELQHLLSVKAPLLWVSLLVMIVWLPLSNQFWAELSASLLCTVLGTQRILLQTQ